MLLLWALWAAVFHHLWRNLDHRTVVSRTTRALLAGTVLELLVAGPVHAWATRKDDDCTFCDYKAACGEDVNQQAGAKLQDSKLVAYGRLGAHV